MKKAILLIIIIMILIIPGGIAFSYNTDLNLTEDEIEWLNQVKGETFTFATENSDNSKYFYNIDGELEGQIFDIASIIEKNLEIEIEVVPYNSINEFIKSIETDTKDIYFGPLSNDEREKYLTFLEPTTNLSYKLVSNNRNLLSLYDLKNVRIGFLKNDYIYNEIIDKLKKYSGNQNPVELYNNEIIFFNSRLTLENALINNEVDAIIEASVSNKMIELTYNIILLDEFELPRDLISVNKKHKYLATILDKLIESDLYQFEDIYKNNEEVFNLTKFYNSLTDEELTWLTNNNQIYYKIPYQLSPILTVNGDKTEGIISEYINNFEKSLGIELLEKNSSTNGVEIEFFEVHNIREGDYENILPYFPFTLNVISNQASDNVNSLHELENNTVALYKDDPLIAYLNLYFPSINIVTFDLYEDAFRSVSNGETDYIVNNKYCIDYYLNDLQFRDLYNVGHIVDYYGFFASSDDETFNSIINKYVLYNNLKNEINNINVSNNKVNILLILAIAIPLLLIIAVILRLYFNLKVETKRRIEVEKSEKLIDEKFENILLSVIESLERATAYNDKETGHHTRRIGDYCSFMAELLGYNSKEINEIANYAQLHDLGKIGVSENVLKKPGKLTDEEYSEIKKHVNIGYEMIKPLNLGEIAENIILYHHERWDGYGYAGLVGNEIPLEALIVCIADSYDAMRMKRVYKDEMTHAEVVEEIKNNSGLQFAPGIVNLFMKYNEKFDEIYSNSKK